MKLTMPWNAAETHKNGISGKLDDVRKALSDEADHLATVAADLGRDIGETAGKVTHDAGSQVASVTQDAQVGASNFAQSLLKGAAGLGAAIAATGRKSMRDAQELSKEARKVRITTEPPKQGPDMMPGVALLGGFSAGLALMFFLDPEHGRRRRSLLRDQLTKWTRVGRETAEGKAKDLRNRTIGAMHETRKVVSGAANGAAEAETSMYAPTGYGSLDNATPSQSTDFGEVPAYNQSTDYGQSTDLGQGTDFGQGESSEYDEQRNLEESRSQVN
jgi:hypothetical protein